MISTKLKTVFVGNTSTGKTSIITRLLRNEFTTTDSTIGSSFFVLDNEDIRYEIWDTAGGERFMALAPMYSRNSHIMIMVYDLDDLSTIDRLQYYFNMIEKFIRMPKIIVIGNKTDLVSEKYLDHIKTFNMRKIENMTKEPLEFIYTSAKTGNGIAEFRQLLMSYGDMLKYIINNNYDTIKLEPQESTDNECKC